MTTPDLAALRAIAEGASRGDISDVQHGDTFDPPTVLALLARIEALETALGQIVRRFEAEDTGQGFPARGGPLAWAMYTDAVYVLAPAASERDAPLTTRHTVEE